MRGSAKNDPYLIARALERRATLKRVLLESGVVVTILIGAYLGYNASNQRHLLGLAREDLAAHRFNEAAQAARSLLEIAPGNLGALEVLATVEENLGSIEALELRKQLAEAQPNRVEPWLKYASDALNFKLWEKVQHALARVPASARTCERFQALSGELNLSMGNAAAAEIFYSEALHLAPTNELYRWQLAAARLRSADAATQTNARAELEAGAAGAPPALPAVRALALESEARGDVSQALAMGIPLLSLEGRTGADQSFVYGLLRKALKGGVGAAFRAFEEKATRNEEEVATLMRWLYAHLHEDDSMPLPKSRPELATCHYAAAHWGKLLEMTGNPPWSELDDMRLAYRAIARQQAGDESAAALIWTQATLSGEKQNPNYPWLVEFARAHHWERAVEEALWAGADNAPDPMWALNELQSLYIEHVDSNGLYRVLSRQAKLDPGNLVVAERFTRVCLLIRRDLEPMKKSAAALYKQDPEKLQYATVYALGLLLNSQPIKALEILNKFPADCFEDPQSAAYYGMALAANQQTDRARRFLEMARGGTLLSEEQELVSTALRQLSAAKPDKAAPAPPPPPRQDPL